jgi:uncharacterized protein YuzE
MKAIHYDAEGDILSITFTESNDHQLVDELPQNHTGIELSDNIVLYYNPETEQPIKLILLSYQGLLQASKQVPILLDTLAEAPAQVQTTVTALLKRAPLTAFLQFVEARDEKTPPTSRLHEIFTPAALQTVAAN